MGFGTLRVINDDTIAPGMGFGMHPHRDMEIITVPLEGVLHHQDSEGHEANIQKGEVQVMSAGTGIVHSEYNASSSEVVKLLQIWVQPKLRSVRPRYQQNTYELKQGEFTLIVSPHDKGGMVSINQDAWFSLGLLPRGQELSYTTYQEGQGLYLFVITGEVKVNGEVLRARDAAGITGATSLQLSGLSDCEVLLMEVPIS